MLIIATPHATSNFLTFDTDQCTVVPFFMTWRPGNETLGRESPLVSLLESGSFSVLSVRGMQEGRAGKSQSQNRPELKGWGRKVTGKQVRAFLQEGLAGLS